MERNVSEPQSHSISDSISDSIGIGKWKLWASNPWAINNLAVYGVEADGNCQFSSIAQALEHHNYKNHKNQNDHNHDHNRNQINGDSIRRLIAANVSDNYKSIPNEDIRSWILNVYLVEVSTREFRGLWRPQNIRTREDFSQAILRPYDFDPPYYMAFQGDYVTLSILSRLLQLNIIIFDYDNKNVNFIEYDQNNSSSNLSISNNNNNNNNNKHRCDNGSYTICLLHYDVTPSHHPNNDNSALNSQVQNYEKTRFSKLRHYGVLGYVQLDSNLGKIRIRSIFEPNQVPESIKNYVKF